MPSSWAVREHPAQHCGARRQAVRSAQSAAVVRATRPRERAEFAESSSESRSPCADHASAITLRN